MADERVTDAIMVAVAEQLRTSAGAGGSSVSNVQVNAGGVAVWLSVSAAVIACLLCILMAIALLYVALQQANHGHQLNAIYRVAPSLEQQVKAELAKKEEER